MTEEEIKSLISKKELEVTSLLQEIEMLKSGLSTKDEYTKLSEDEKI